MGTFQTARFRQPFAFGRYVEQNTSEHVRSCQMSIAMCAVGERQERPEFGWESPLGRPIPVDFTSLVNALKTLEPRDLGVTVEQAANIFGEVTAVVGDQVATPVPAPGPGGLPGEAIPLGDDAA